MQTMFTILSSKESYNLYVIVLYINNSGKVQTVNMIPYILPTNFVSIYFRTESHLLQYMTKRRLKIALFNISFMAIILDLVSVK